MLYVSDNDGGTNVWDAQKISGVSKFIYDGMF